tara:strand:+ start:945 stop:1121 length:177 start_codon:yes stop_codon:yes gene_type:complete
MADPLNNRRIYPEESTSETFSPRRPFGKKKKKETFKQLELDLARIENYRKKNNQSVNA